MEQIFNKTLKAGKSTYFLDVKEAKNQSKYLAITASAPSKEDPQKFSKHSVLVFNNVIDEFIGTLKEATQEIGSESPFTKTVRAGKITYFVDVKEAKNKSKYLSITATQPSKDDAAKFTRSRITVFDNAAQNFIAALEETAGYTK